MARGLPCSASSGASATPAGGAPAAGVPSRDSAVDRIVRAGLCSGCGLCAGMTPGGKVRMEMAPPGYLRPRAVAPLTPEEDAAIDRACPGRSLDFSALPDAKAPRHVLWGPLVSVSTAWATDDDLRRWGSSGGGISALLVQLLESGTVDGVVHVTASRRDPLRNAVVVSRDRDAVLAGAGSRYAPSAPLEEVGVLLEGGERLAFVGKPCDVAGLRNLARLDRRVDQTFPLMLSFMCAGIPSQAGTEEILGHLGLEPGEVRALRYRGDGWPGYFRAVGADGEARQMDYATSWGGVLNRHIQWRCKICPDGTGEFADVVCADAWYEDETGMPTFNERDGRSLLLARSARGEQLVRAAAAAGHLVTEPLDVDEIDRMQPFQKKRRQLVLSRLAGMALLGRRLPRYRAARLVGAARTSRLVAQLRSCAGTALRIARGRFT